MGVVALAGALMLPIGCSTAGSSQRVYTHTYDEAFQGAQDAIERMGLFVTGADQPSGHIQGDGTYRVISGRGPMNVTATFSINIETVSAKPETRVIVQAETGGCPACPSWAKRFREDLLAQLQKVLATYR